MLDTAKVRLILLCKKFSYTLTKQRTKRKKQVRTANITTKDEKSNVDLKIAL